MDQWNIRAPTEVIETRRSHNTDIDELIEDEEFATQRN
jgi:hypothetical protein